jgi:hypothetical protein
MCHPAAVTPQDLQSRQAKAVDSRPSHVAGQCAMGMIRRARRQARDPASGSFGHRPVGAALSLTSGCSASNRSRATRKGAIHPSGARSATSWRTVRSSALPYRGASYRRSKQAIETGDLHHGRGVHDAPLDRRPLLEDVVERGSGAQIAGHAASSQARQGAVIRGADALIISDHGDSGGPIDLLVPVGLRAQLAAASSAERSRRVQAASETRPRAGAERSRWCTRVRRAGAPYA